MELTARNRLTRSQRIPLGSCRTATDSRPAAEYDYVDVGTPRVNFTTANTALIPGAVAAFPLDVRERVSVFLFGINYRFNAWGPVIAKY